MNPLQQARQTQAEGRRRGWKDPAPWETGICTPESAVRLQDADDKRRDLLHRRKYGQ